eukprot:5221356-Amphidinium_carterae.1
MKVRGGQKEVQVRLELSQEFCPLCVVWVNGKAERAQVSSPSCFQGMLDMRPSAVTADVQHERLSVVVGRFAWFLSCVPASM